MTELKPHPIAQCFPKLDKADFAKMVASVKAHGMADPIWLYEGMILDGRHRYHACIRAGAGFQTREYRGDDPVGFAVAINDNRRHYTAGQKAAVASALAALPQGQRPRQMGGVPTIREAAGKVGVSVDSVKKLRRVEAASPATAKAVADGKISLNRAERIVEEKAKPTAPPPTNKLAAAKEEAGELRQLAHEVLRIKKRLVEIAADPIGRELIIQRVEEHAGNLYNTIMFAVPAAACGYCGGKGERGCRACKGSGWVTKGVESATPKGLKIA